MRRIICLFVFSIFCFVGIHAEDSEWVFVLIDHSEAPQGNFSAHTTFNAAINECLNEDVASRVSVKVLSFERSGLLSSLSMDEKSKLRQLVAGGQVKGFLYQPNEHDNFNGLWHERLKSFYHDLYSSLGVTSDLAPLYVGQLADATGGQNSSANEVIAQLPHEMHNVYVVFSNDCEAVDGGVSFSQAGKDCMARKFAKKVMERMAYFLPAKARHEASDPVVTEVQTVDVEAYVEDHVLHATADRPLKSVEVIEVSSGETIKTVELDGEQTVSLSLNELGAQSLKIIFHAVDGSNQEIECNR